MPVDSLIGYKGRDVKLNYYASFAPKTYVEALRKLALDLKLNVIGIVAQPFAVARAYSGSSSRDFSAMFVDIGGGTTDIAVVDQGSVVETKMFAFGGRTFTKEIVRSGNIEYRIAEQRKLKYSKRELTRELSRDLVASTSNTPSPSSSTDTSKVPPPKSYTRILCELSSLSSPYAKEAAVGSFIIRLTSSPAIFPASLVACF